MLQLLICLRNLIIVCARASLFAELLVLYTGWLLYVIIEFGCKVCVTAGLVCVDMIILSVSNCFAVFNNKIGF